MPRERRHTRQKLLDAAYALFYCDGFTRVGVDTIAEAAGVTKRTLYAHFESKDALLAAVLEDQNPRVLAGIARWADEAADLGEFIDSLFGALAHWAREKRWRGSGFTRVAMELADQPGHPARAAARRHKAMLEAWLAERLAALGAADPPGLARQLQVLMEGAMALTLIHDGRGHIDAAHTAAQHMIGPTIGNDDVSKAGKSMLKGAREALAYAQGERQGFLTHLPDEVDVRAIRKRLGLSQRAFAETFGFRLDAIQNWEQGRRRPERPARLLLRVIDREPEAVRRALAP